MKKLLFLLILAAPSTYGMLGKIGALVRTASKMAPIVTPRPQPAPPATLLGVVKQQTKKQ